MGRGKKKRNPLLPPDAATDGGGATPSDSNPNQEEQSKIDQDSSIESECQAAIEAHIGGSPAEALILMNETRLRNEDCGLVHATQCKLHHLEAGRIGASGGALFQNHLRSAVESARRAVSLSPDSEEFGTLYGEALYKLSREVEGFDVVLGECERALSVQNPLQHSRDASLSFKALVAMVSKEQSNSQSSKEIGGNAAKMGKSRTYWNAMSDERKMGLIELRIGDLKDYCKSLRKNGLAERVLSEGIDYADKNKTWKFWACYYCDENFHDFGLRTKHIEREHEGEIGPDFRMKPFLFTEIDADGGGSEVYDIFLANGTVFITDMERVVFTGDPSRPLDDRLLRVDVEYGSASTCDAEVAVPPDIDAFTQWLFGFPPDPTAKELEASWSHLQDHMKRDGMEVPMRFEQEFALFQSLRRRQGELMVQCRSLRAMQIVCAQELWKRGQGGEHVRRSYESLLKKMVEYISPTRGSQLEATVGVIQEAGRNPHSSNSQVEDQEDASIRKAIETKMEQPLSELCTNEARITMSNGVLWRLLVIYKQASLDYRVIVVALVRNFIHAKLEALVSEEEKQKADAVFEELMSGVSIDTKKTTSKGNIDPKLSKKTSKAKKKIKDQREVKDSKATCSNEVTVEKEEKAEQVYFPVADASADELKLQEESLRKKLEYQRQFEDEAKQKALDKETTTNEAAPMNFRALFP